MKDPVQNIEGYFYPVFHCGWGGCAEELFHHTSRYYAYAEAFLRNLSDDRGFSMTDYKADLLSEDQRLLMAAVLACKPDENSASALMEIVTSVSQGKTFVNPHLLERYAEQILQIPKGVKLAYKQGCHAPNREDPSPLDPFLNIAERLRLPVAIKEHHVEVSLHQLAQHLDSPIPNLRTNLQNAILQLHAAGFLLRNHPGLTHQEAKAIGGMDAV